MAEGIVGVVMALKIEMVQVGLALVEQFELMLLGALKTMVYWMLVAVIFLVQNPWLVQEVVVVLPFLPLVN